MPRKAHPTDSPVEGTLAPFSRTLVQLIGAIPVGAVSTYGDLAAAAGQPRAARQVARLLHSAASRYHLPWHRVVNRSGRIALTEAHAFARQRTLLLEEGVTVTEAGQLDLAHYRWLPPASL